MLRTQDLPPLYCDFDESSVSAQRMYLRVLLADFGALVLAGVVSSYTVEDVATQRALAAMTAILFALGMVITVVLSKNPYEKVWYGGRAAAETVKSLAWKYMLRAAPFEGDPSSKQIDAAFLNRLQGVLNERRELALSRASISRADAPISQQMRTVRAYAMKKRLEFYLAERVQDQVDWYSAKSRHNEKRQQIWFWAIISSQFFALVGAVWLVTNPTFLFNYSTAFAAIATAMLAWSQLKRHRELAQSYSLAAHELGIASGLAPHIDDEEALSQFVNDTEAAISREHTMWIARREATA